MTTERQARSWFMRCCEEVRSLERLFAAPAFLPRDPADFARLTERLRMARAAKRIAHEELRLYKNAPPRTRPVRL